MRNVYYIKNEAEVHGLSVRNMQRITIYALKKHRKAILESLQRKGVLEVENLQLEDSAFVKEQTAQKQALFLKTSSAAGQAYEALCSYLPEKRKLLSMFEGRSLISVAEYDSFVAESSEIMRTAYRVNDLQKAVSDAKAEIIRLQTQIEALQPWKTFDIPLRFQGTVATAAFIGTLPEFFSYAQLLSRLARLLPQIQDLALEIVSASQEQTCFFLVCSRSSAQQVEEALRSMGYARPPADSEFTPVQRIAQLKEHIREEKDAIETAQAEIISYAGMKNAFRFMEDYYVMRAEKYSIIERLENTKHMFLLTGYAMADRVHEIASELTKKYGAAVEVEQPKEKEAPPVALQNNRFAQPVESVLETYSLPARGEVDPTFVMSIFYYIFFGMMFSDAGYGLVMTLGCAFLLKKFKNMEEGLKKSVKMFLGCGISTVFWGVLFGSYFGDAVTVIGKTFFQVDVAIPPLWFNPVEGTNSMTLLMVAFLLGIIHIFVGLGMQGYMHIKNGRPLDAVCDVLSWYLLVGGGILALLSIDMLKSLTGFVLPPVCMAIGGICAAAGAVLILCFAGRGSKPVKRFLKGAYGLYGVTGYLSDILSYSRLLALGLATGVIAQVFNQIGAMFGGGIGILPFTVVFLIGHTLNISINALGAYVHTNRLQFVEFFGKFYEGGGKKFTPFQINTKHYKIKEEIYHG